MALESIALIPSGYKATKVYSQLPVNGNGDFTFDRGGIYIFGAQLEEQSYATSYIRSLSGVSGVRNAETCNGAGTTAEINSQQGVLFFEGRALANDGTSRIISLGDGTTTNRIMIFYNSDDNKINAQLAISGS